MKINVKTVTDSKKDKIKAMIVEKSLQKWYDEMPKEFFDDLESLCAEATMFNMKWGFEVTAKDLIKKHGIS